MVHPLLDALDWDRVRDESLALLQDLIRIDTTNPPGGEIAACRLLERVFEAEGIPCEAWEPAPGRGNLVARLSGSGRQQPLLLSAHLDVVPAESREWTHPPFGAVLDGGYLWGRGAIDMKNMAAMEVACLLALRRGRVRLHRDVIFAAVADEEAGCTWGSMWLAERHPELVRAEYALSEVGGFTVHVGKARYYPVQVAEKGVCWMTVTARGRPGHGSMPSTENAVARIGEAAARLGRTMPPLHRTPVVERYIHGLASRQPAWRRWAMGGLLHPWFSDLILDHVVKDESQRNALRAALHDTANPTVLRAGYKVNVIPGEATMQVDGRTLPGRTTADLVGEVQQILGAGYQVAVDHELAPVVGDFDDPLTTVLQRSIDRHDPGALAIPYLVPGFTDAKAWAPLGIKCFGFSPIRLGPQDSFGRWFHGNDERIPVDGFHFGVRVLLEVVLDLVTGES